MIWKNNSKIFVADLAILLLGSLSLIQAQNAHVYSENPALEATLFAPGIISTDAQEWDITFEPDGRTTYFTRRVKGERQKIYFSRFADGKWTKSEVAPFSTDVDENAFITADGKRFFFSSLRTLPGRKPANGYDTNIWVMEKMAQGWGQPKPIAGEVNTFRKKGQNFPAGVENGPFIGKDKTLYYWSKNPKGTDSDIFEAKLRKGKYTMPESLPMPLNTKFWESYPAISPDGRFLIFNAYGRPDGFGAEDLYISFRLPGSWSYPRNLGEKVNGKYDDNFARFSPDGRYLFFSSNRPKKDEKEGNASIYFIETKALDLTDKPIPEPNKFAYGIISSNDYGENSLSFSPDGKVALFSRYKGDWETQTGYFSKIENGKWSKPEKVSFIDTLYNAAFSNDGSAIIFSQRMAAETVAPEVFLTSRTKNGWKNPVSLSKKYKIRGGYFTILSDKTLYFQTEGEIYRAEFKDGGYTTPEKLSDNINTPNGTEFSQFVDEKESFIIFARYTDGDKSKTGLFLSLKDEEGNWGRALRLPLPYGWSPTISPDGKNLVYTIDEDIVSIPLKTIGLCNIFRKF